MTEWESVADYQLEYFPDQRRTAESLKRKFRDLYSRTPPTGNPKRPPVVERAQHHRQ